MVRLRYWHLCLSVLLVMTACKDDTSQLDVNTTVMEFTHSGGSQILRIECDDDWSLYGISDWITASQYSGINSQEVTITVSPNETRLDREQKITVQSNDSKNVRVIKIVQYGLTGGRLLKVDDISEKYFNGKVSFDYLDSIVVNCSGRWTITGPSWLGAKFNNKTSNLNGEIKEGSGTLYLRPVSVNSDENELRGTICIQTEAGDATIEIPVVQLGCYDVKCIDKMILSDCIGCRFRYGKNVEYFQYALLSGYATEEEISNIKWSHIEAEDDVFYRRGGLTPNAIYTMCMRGMPSLEKHYKKVCTEIFNTPSESGQPRATIENVEPADGRWRFDAIMNEQAIGYYTFTWTENQNISKATTAYALFNMLKKSQYESKYRTYSTRWTTPDNCFATWAVGADGNLSSVMDIYQLPTTSSSGNAPLMDKSIEHIGTMRISQIFGKNNDNLIINQRLQ